MNLSLFQECYASLKRLVMATLKENLCFISAQRKGTLSHAPLIGRATTTAAATTAAATTAATTTAATTADVVVSVIVSHSRVHLSHRLLKLSCHDKKHPIEGSGLPQQLPVFFHQSLPHILVLYVNKRRNKTYVKHSLINQFFVWLSHWD